jgi:hypothetical protein
MQANPYATSKKAHAAKSKRLMEASRPIKKVSHSRGMADFPSLNSQA